jgi:hypothetical protein
VNGNKEGKAKQPNTGDGFSVVVGSTIREKPKEINDIKTEMLIAGMRRRNIFIIAKLEVNDKPFSDDYDFKMFQLYWSRKITRMLEPYTGNRDESQIVVRNIIAMT